MTGRWLRIARPVPYPRARLVCLPHAGGNATAFQGWDELLPADVEVATVCYPGRLERFAEPMPLSLRESAAEVAAALLPRSDVPVALFGHSMGAVVAYEAAALLAGHGASPALLIVSGREAPQFAHHSDLHSADDATLVAHCLAMGAAGREAFADPELRELLLPVLRDDLRLIDSHVSEPGGRVAAPIVAYVGDRDPGCTVAEAGGWSAATTGSFELRVFPGDHFYFTSGLPNVTADLSDRLGKMAAASPQLPGRRSGPPQRR